MELSYKKIYPSKYAEQIKRKFYENPSLWYKVIVPEEAAERLKTETQGDYSQIWQEHCQHCWSSITAETDDECYVSTDEQNWLCKNCFDKFNKLKGSKLKLFNFKTQRLNSDDHCMICWNRQEHLSEGYIFLNDNSSKEWICKDCFNDFHTWFQWESEGD